jgi:hypothetical protein
MSNQSANYKNLIKKGNCCVQSENLTKQTYNNNYNKSKKMVESNIIVSQTKNGGGIIRYGNFGSLLNGKVVNNEIVSALIDNIKQQENSNIYYNNYVYVNNLINTYSNEVSCRNNVVQNENQYNYNQFYQNYNELQRLLTQKNIYQNSCISTKYI